MTQLALDWARAQGDIGSRRAESAADRRMPEFSRRACDYFLALLATRGPMSGEDLVDAARAAGFCPPDDRAFGRAFRLLTERGAQILRSDLPRKRGHGTSGGKLYGIAGQ